MGCGKSKHAVETATTVIKSSTSPDGAKQTTTATNTVKETGDASLMQKQVIAKSFVEEDASKTTVTTKVDPSGVAKNDTLVESIDKPTEILKDDVKVKEPDTTDNVIPDSVENVGGAEIMKVDEKMKDCSLVDVRGENTNNVVTTLGKEDVGVAEVVKDGEGKKEPILKADTKVKVDNVPFIEDEKMKESILIKDNKTKTEFMTPTLSEDVVAPFGKSHEELKDLKEENISTIIEGSSNPKDDILKVEEQKLVAKAAEPTKVEAKKEAKISPTTESEKVSSEANVAVEKQP